jgi:hypothetical protein
MLGALNTAGIAGADRSADFGNHVPTKGAGLFNYRRNMLGDLTPKIHMLVA